MRRVLIIFIIFTLITIGIKTSIADSPWPTFHGNNQRTGLSIYNTSHVDGTVKWSFETEDAIESSPAIDENGTIYIGSHNGYLYAIRKNGELHWKIKLGTPKKKEYYGHNISISSSPAIGSDGTIYIASHDQYLHAISPEGIEKWKFSIGFAFDGWASPVIGEDGTVYITSNIPKLGVYAITPDGAQKWFYNAGANMFNSPSLGDDGTIYVGIPSEPKTNKLVALNENGAKIWDRTTSLFLESTPAIADDGTIYVGSFTDSASGGGLYAFSSNGVQKWYKETPAKEVWATPAIDKNGNIYFGATDNNFYAVDSAGNEKWHFDTGGEVGSSAAIGADGLIYFGSGSGNFYAVYPNGTIKWRLQLSSISSSPAIGANGTIYVGCNDHRIYAIGDSSEDTKNNEELIIIFHENVTEEQALNLLHSHSINYLFSKELWVSKKMKLYIPEDKQYMFSETLKNEEIVSSIGSDDEEEKTINEQEEESEPENETIDLDSTINKTSKNNETPGFGVIMLILAVSIILILKRKMY